MFEKIKTKIEKNRNSDKILFKIMVFLKDFLWQIKEKAFFIKRIIFFTKDYLFVLTIFILIKLSPKIFGFSKNFKENFTSLKRKIETVLKNKISSDYCLLDTPNHHNPGDHLIYLGTTQFLTKLPYRKKYTTSFNFFLKKIKSENMI